MARIFTDIECYKNLFYIGFKRKEDGRRVGFEYSNRTLDFDRNRVRQLIKNNVSIGFNSLTYDIPMIYLALSGASNLELKEASDRIIKGRVPWWKVEDALGISIPKIDHIDLFEPNPAVRQGLKLLNGRLHGKRLQDLPYDPNITLNDRQIDETIDYCLHSDLDATENLYDALREPLELREALSLQYDMDMRSKSDAQVGEAIIKKRVQQITGNRIKKEEARGDTHFYYDVPDFIQFETPLLRNILDTVRNTAFYIDYDCKVAFPKEFEDFHIEIGESVYQMGIGGLHSTESNRAIRSDNEYVLVDADVASQYPRIIMTLGLYPEAIGKVFLTVYGDLIKDRLVAKAAGDKVKDKAGKIALNGAYGKLGSKYSALYAPHLMIAVTLTGQLSLLMLIEKAEAAGISVVSANTDGVVFKLRRDWYEGVGTKGADKDRLLGGKLKEITDWWEKLTGFTLEFAEYRAIYNQSVNSYIAIKSDGKVKRKGPIGNPWSERKEENDLRGQMMKNPQMTICSDAVLELILNGTPIEETIRGCNDVRAFVTVVNAAGGATWRDGYLGKVVRYYWSTDGDPIVKVKAHATTGNRPKVPKTDGCRPMMTLPDELPDDIDYNRYIAESNQILEDIGYSEKTIVVKPVRVPKRLMLANADMARNYLLFN